ncbi:MAG: hypothetical protein M3Y53_01440 [Thermoproteota archaeon]|nr:hypothetical protein [Thermoproteota archaeon]
MSPNTSNVIVAVILSIGIGIIFFEMVPEKSMWSIPVKQQEGYAITVPAVSAMTTTMTIRSCVYCQKTLNLPRNAEAICYQCYVKIKQKGTGDIPHP